MDQQFWDSINNDLAKNRIEKVIDTLQSLKSLPKDYSDQILGLSSQYNSLQREQRLGIISFSDYRREMARISYAFNSLVSEIKSEMVVSPAASGKTKILFLAANPEDTGKLRLDQEFRDIDEGLRRAKQRDNFELVSRWAVRPRDLRRAMIEETPNIIHFSGHGETYAGPQSELKNEESTRIFIVEEEEGVENKEKDHKSESAYTGGIVLMGENSDTQIVDASALGDLIRLASIKVGKIDCILLNACYSAVQAREFQNYVRYVIGMNSAVSDRAAIVFAVAFYDALGAGEDIPFAFELAKVAIKLEGLKGSDIPVLHKGVDS
ncbi:MAG: CHAT domain-containing protein [Bacteroidetes bacterium]|nr:CHAT domain-containing protein [Bacteroidota bacterium]